MRVKDLIIELQKVYDKEKWVYYGNSQEDEKKIITVREKEFAVYIKE